MGRTRKDTVKLKTECGTCGNYTAGQCKKGFNIYCRRRSRKKCAAFEKVSITEAAKELAAAAGVDLNKI